MRNCDWRAAYGRGRGGGVHTMAACLACLPDSVCACCSSSSSSLRSKSANMSSSESSSSSSSGMAGFDGCGVTGCCRWCCGGARLPLRRGCGGALWTGFAAEALGGRGGLCLCSLPAGCLCAGGAVRCLPRCLLLFLPQPNMVGLVTNYSQVFRYTSQRDTTRVSWQARAALLILSDTK